MTLAWVRLSPVVRVDFCFSSSQFSCSPSFDFFGRPTEKCKNNFFGVFCLVDITLNPPSCSVEGIFADMEANQCLPRKVLVAFSKSDPVPMTESVVLYARHCLGIDINTPPLLI